MSAKRMPVVAISLCFGLMAGLTTVAVGQDEADMRRRPVEDPVSGVGSVVPEDWQALSGGVHARGTPPDDLTLIAIESSPVSVAEFWPVLLARVARSDIPDVTGGLETDAFDWMLFAFDVEVPGFELSAELALADADGTTYVVFMQADRDEFEILREQVFLPAVEAFHVLAPGITPDPATLGYAVQDVAFPGGSDGVVLAGTLTLPFGPGPHPVVVLMSGSGPQDRDSSFAPLAPIEPFALIADALTSGGVGILRYDDRGIGGSTGDHPAATVEDFTRDGRAALDFLSGRDDIDEGAIGILGHSEGGLYVATLAAEDPRVAFAIGMAAPAIDGVSLLIAHTEAIVRASGASVDQVQATIDFAERVMPAALEGDADKVEAAVRDSSGALWDLQPPDSQAVLGEREIFVQRQVDAQVPALLSDWCRSILASDPSAMWSQVRVPVLGLFGAKDVQVPLEPNEPAWRAALEAAGNDDVTSVVLPDANHLFQAADTGSVQEYSSLGPEFTRELLPRLVEWVRERAGVDA